MDHIKTLLREPEQLSLDDLRTLQHALTSLSSSPGWGHYLKYLDVQLESREQGLCYGKLGTSVEEELAEVRMLRGEISGLFQAKTALEYLCEQVEGEIYARDKTEEDT